MREQSHASPFLQRPILFMSRLLVKNLPKHLTEERFKQHFSTLGGEITDCKIIKTSYTLSYILILRMHSDGRSRQFGFIGYRSEKQAKKALKYFQRSFIDTSKIELDWALPVTAKAPTGTNTTELTPRNFTTGAGEKPKLERDINETVNAVKTYYQEDASNEKLREFLNAMQPRSKTRTWANDDAGDAINVALPEQAKKAPKVIAKVSAVPSKKPGGDQVLLSKTHIKFAEEDETEELDQVNVVLDPNISDLEYMKSRMKANAEGPPMPEETISSSTELKKKEKEEEQSPEQIIMETGRLFLRNLPFSASEEDLRKYFDKFGPLSEIHIPLSKDTKQPFGIAYVLFLLPEHALKAFHESDGKFFQGRLLHVLPGKEKLGKTANEENTESQSNLSFKKQREKKRKGNATLSFNWNSLYMNADAVAESIAQQLSITKAQIFDREADNMAVRLAMAETQVISDAKTYFEKNGVNIDAFGGKEFSDKVILVKNIPYGTTREELTELFGKHGALGRVLVPPSQTIAIVEFLEDADARSAFRRLAYAKFKSGLLYLEKAPLSVFTGPPPPPETATVAGTTDATEVKKAPLEVKELYNPVEEEDNDDIKTLFIKNLNFSTTEDRVRQMFEGIGRLRSVVIRKKEDPKRPGQKLSLGFGFVEYHRAQDATIALKSLQGVMIDNHSLELKFSQRNSSSTTTMAKNNKEEGSNKVVVRNIAFEATKKELLELFSAYGQVKSIRLPKKLNGQHRGFAFVEFLTKQEAKNAMQAISATHLYGRHLVTEYAKEGDFLDEERDKAKRQVEQERNFEEMAKRRKRIEEDDGGEF